QPRQEAHHVADQHGLAKLHAVDRRRHQEGLLAAGQHHFTAGTNRPGLVDVAEDDAAEDAAERIRVARHHHDLDRQISFGHVHVSLPSSRLTLRTPSTMFANLRQATNRAVCENPQSGVTETRSGSIYFSTSRNRSATSSGGSTQVFFTSTNPTASSS